MEATDRNSCRECQLPDTDRAREQPAGHSQRVWMAFVAALIVGAALPFVLGNFAIYNLTFAGIYAIAIIGMNLLTGYNGQFSLGHSAFYALGGYTTAMLALHFGMSAYATIPLAGLVGLAAGFLFGLPASRLAFFYSALATYGFALAVPQVLKSSWLERMTGGVQGLYLDRPEVPAGVPLTADQWWYFVTAGVLLVMWWLGRNLVAGRYGRAMVAIRDHSISAAAMGIDVTKHKAMTFGISALYAAVAGSLNALMTEYIAPDTFTFRFAILLLVGAVVGGVESISGAVIGGLFLLYTPKLADMISKNLSWPIYGAMLIVFIWIMPNGAAGMLGRLAQRFSRQKN
jgi:branched-chain amino acid transport system permease protein